MDKQEYREIVGDIRRAHDNQEYDKVLMYADELDMRKVSDSRVLEMISDAYAVSGDLETARSMLLKAYEKTPMGRKLAYKLSEISIQLGDLDGAVDFYEDFCKMAPHDNDRYLLKYKIGKAGRVPKKDLAHVLASYCSKEVDEKWMAELAGLYDAVGEKEKCGEVCDDIILWFADGEYVQKALELKSRNGGLTQAQQDKLDLLKAQSLRAVKAAEHPAAAQKAEEEDREFRPGNMDTEAIREKELDSILEEYITVEDATAPPQPPSAEDMAEAMAELDDAIDYVDISEPETEVIPIEEIREAADNAEDALSNIQEAKAEAAKSAAIEAALSETKSERFSNPIAAEVFNADSILEELELQTAPVHEEVQDIIAGNMGKAKQEDIPDVLSGSLRKEPNVQAPVSPAPAEAVSEEAAPAEEIYEEPAPAEEVYEEPAQAEEVYEEPAPAEEYYEEPAPAEEYYEEPAPAADYYDEAALAEEVPEGAVSNAELAASSPAAAAAYNQQFFSNIRATQSARTAPPKTEEDFWKMPEELTLEEEAEEEEFAEPVYGSHRWFEEKTEPNLQYTEPIFGAHRFVPRPEEEEPEESDVIIEQVEPEPIVIEQAEEEEAEPEHVSTIRTTSSGAELLGLYAAAKAAGPGKVSDQASLVRKPKLGVKRVSRPSEGLNADLFVKHRTEPAADYYDDMVSSAEFMAEEAAPAAAFTAAAEFAEAEAPEYAEEAVPVTEYAEAEEVPAAEFAEAEEIPAEESAEAEEVPAEESAEAEEAPAEEFAEAEEVPAEEFAEAEEAPAEEFAEAEEAPAEEFTEAEEVPAAEFAEAAETPAAEDGFEQDVLAFETEQSAPEELTDFERAVREFERENKAEDTDDEDLFAPEMEEFLGELGEEGISGVISEEEAPAEEPKPGVRLEDTLIAAETEFIPAALVQEQIEIDSAIDAAPQLLEDEAEDIDATGSELFAELFDEEPDAVLPEETEPAEAEEEPEEAEAEAPAETAEAELPAEAEAPAETEEAEAAAEMEAPAEAEETEPEAEEAEPIEETPAEELPEEPEQPEEFTEEPAESEETVPEAEQEPSEEAAEEVAAQEDAAEAEASAEPEAPAEAEALPFLAATVAAMMEEDEQNAKEEEAFEQNLESLKEEQENAAEPDEFERTIQEFEQEHLAEADEEESPEEAAEQEEAEAEPVAAEAEEDDDYDEEEDDEDDTAPAPFLFSVMPHSTIEEVVPDIVKENLEKERAAREAAQKPAPVNVPEADEEEDALLPEEQFEQQMEALKQEQEEAAEPGEFERTVQEFEQEHLAAETEEAPEEFLEPEAIAEEVSEEAELSEEEAPAETELFAEEEEAAEVQEAEPEEFEEAETAEPDAFAAAGILAAAGMAAAAADEAAEPEDFTEEEEAAEPEDDAEDAGFPEEDLKEENAEMLEEAPQISAEPGDFERFARDFDNDRFAEEEPEPFSIPAYIADETEAAGTSEPEAEPSVYIPLSKLAEDRNEKIVTMVTEKSIEEDEFTEEELTEEYTEAEEPEAESEEGAELTETYESDVLSFEDAQKADEENEFERAVQDFELTHRADGDPDWADEYGVAEPQVAEEPIIEITASIPKVEEFAETEAEPASPDTDMAEAEEPVVPEETVTEAETLEMTETPVEETETVEAVEPAEEPEAAGAEEAEPELSDFEKAMLAFEAGRQQQEEDFTPGDFDETMDELMEEAVEPWEEPEFGLPDFAESEFEKPEYIGNDFDSNDTYMTERLQQEAEEKDAAERIDFEKALEEFEREQQESLIEPLAEEPEYEPELPQEESELAEEAPVSSEEAAGPKMPAFAEEYTPTPVMELPSEEADTGASATGYQIPDELREELSEFLLIDGMEERICRAIGSIIEQKRSGDPTGGHLIITGDAKSGKTYLTISIIKAVGKEIGSSTGRVAKVQAESLNGKDMKKVFAKIAGSDLIIENAGYLNEETIQKLIQVMQTTTSGTMVVLEGNKLGIENILTKTPELESCFRTRLNLDELSLSQWADLACEYAESKGYKVGDMALLALHAKIDEMNLPTTRLVVDDIQGMIDQAIEKANKRSSGRFLGRRKGREGGQELDESDFM